MFDIAIKNSECFTRILRFLCYFLLVASICMFFSPITTILGYIPLVGGFISGIVGFAIFLAALLVSIPIFFLVTSIAWLRYRPIIGAALLIIGLGILTFFIVYNKSKGGDAPPNAAHFMAFRPIHLWLELNISSFLILFIQIANSNLFTIWISGLPRLYFWQLY